MKVYFWGTRGSIATPGEETVKYGGNTTCLEIQLSDGSFMIIDAGTGIRKLGMKLVKLDLDEINIFLTHPHWDHIQGFPFFTPMYKNNEHVIIHGWPTTNRKVKNVITDQMEGTYFPVDFSQLSAEIDFREIKSDTLEYNSAKLSFLRCNHPVICHSFKIEDGGKTFVIMTDNELDANSPKNSWEEFVEFCRGADLLIHDAQFTPEELKIKKGWGHSDYLRVIDLASEAEVEKLVLFHHDPGHNDRFIDKLVENSLDKIKKLKFPKFCIAAREGMEMEV